MIGPTGPGTEIEVPERMDYMAFDMRFAETPDDVFTMTSNLAKWVLAAQRMNAPTGAVIHLADDLSVEVLSTYVRKSGWVAGVSLLKRDEDSDDDRVTAGVRFQLGPLLTRSWGVALAEALVTADVLGLLELPDDYPDVEALYTTDVVQTEAQDMVKRLLRWEGEPIQAMLAADEDPRTISGVKPSWPTGSVAVVAMRDDDRHKDGEFYIGVQSACPSCGEVGTVTIPWRLDEFQREVVEATLFAFLQLDSYRLLKVPDRHGHNEVDYEDDDD